MPSWRPKGFGWPQGLLIELLVMVVGTALIWMPVTLWTQPVDRATLTQFYERVQPPGWWKGFTAASARPRWGTHLGYWLVATYALLATTIGPLQVMVGPRAMGWGWCVSAAAAWAVIAAGLWRRRGPSQSTPRTGPAAAPSSTAG